LHADGAKTFQAVEKSSRRDVLLHLVDKSASPELIDKVKHLQTGQERDLVEVGEFAGSYYVVTTPIADFGGLGRWLDERVSNLLTRPPAADPPIADPPARPAAPGSGGGTSEFTQMFGRSDAKPATAPEPLAKPQTSPTVVDVQRETAPQSPRPRRAAPPPDDEPGEFTRLFGEAERAKPRPVEPEPSPAPAAASSKPKGGSGDFTQLFGEAQPARPAPSAPPPAPAPAPSAGAGEFTQMFGGPAHAEAKPEYLSPAQQKPAGGPPPGQFTQMFAPAAAEKTSTPPPAAPPANSRDANASGEFTRKFGSPAKASGPAPRLEPKTPAPDGELAKSSGEFTRLFGNPGGAERTAPKLQPAASARGGEIEKSSGEFTRLFGPGGKGAQPAKPPPSSPLATPRPGFDRTLGAPDGAPGEFTEMFGDRPSRSSTGFGHGAPLAARPPAASFGDGLVGEISGDEALAAEKGPRVSKNSKPFQAPGEFTRMFGPSDPSQPPPEDFIPTAQRAGAEGYASGLFRNPHAEPKPAKRLPALGGGPVNQAGEPGDYTLQFEKGAKPMAVAPASAQPAPPQPAITPAAPAAAGPKKGMLIALVMAVLIAGLSLGAAVYLYFNRSTDDAPADPPAVEQTAEPGATGGR
jgi:hypothetical protein